jgi:thioredoxin-like negative regulator of GroEL
MGRSRIFVVLSIVTIGIGLAWPAWYVAGGWQVRRGLNRAKRQINSGQYGAALDRLAQLSTRWPRHGEVEYLLGVCESALGRTERALAAWARVPLTSPRAAPAALARGRALVKSQSRFIEAEAAYRAAMKGSRPEAVEARWALAVILLWQGRLDEVSRLLKEIWRVGQDRDRVAALREMWRLDSVVVAAEEIQPVLDQAAQLAPDDDRVWLARAYLASRYGRHSEANVWVKAALLKCPEDLIIRRAAMQCAIAADDYDTALHVAAQIPAERFTASERLSVRAWFAARWNDSAAERAALEQLIASEPGNTRALDRLAMLLYEAGQTHRAAILRQQGEAVSRDQERYRRLLVEDRASIPSNEFRLRASLAERLGRRFEARGWLTLAREREPSDQVGRDSLERLARESSGRNVQPGGSLADFIGSPTRCVAVPKPVASSPTDLTRKAILFRDDAAPAGLRFTYDNNESSQHQIPETIGGGVAVLDYDRDGWLDVYVVQGGPLLARRADAQLASDNRGSNFHGTLGDRLFRNRRDGTFEDVTDGSGVSRVGSGYGFGVAAGDYDGDGHPDLFVTRFGSYLLLHNDADGSFSDATERAGLGGERDWPTSAAFADFDGDGDLDLYVCHYLAWDAEHPTVCDAPNAPDRHVSCLPLKFRAMPDHLFRNDGGRFVDVSAAAGIVDHDGRGLGVIAADLDDDRRVDLYVANDMTANYLFHNTGGMKFEEIGHQAGAACNAEGGYQAGMGVACGDFNGDGTAELAVTNFFGESTTLYRNLGGAIFADATAASGLKAPSRFLLGFGITFLDADNDGYLDLATANGHIHDLRPKIPYAMPAQLLTSDRKGRLTDVTAQSGAVWNVARIGRGLANADLDNDGRVDLLLVAQNSPLAYLHNQTSRAGHFVTLHLEGAASNRDAIGVRVTVTSGGRRQTAWRIGGGSYASASDPRLHFGLGQERMIDTIEVSWPSGRVEQFRNMPADTGYLIRESEPKPLPLNAFATRKAS